MAGEDFDEFDDFEDDIQKAVEAEEQEEQATQAPAPAPVAQKRGRPMAAPKVAPLQSAPPRVAPRAPVPVQRQVSSVNKFEAKHFKEEWVVEDTEAEIRYTGATPMEVVLQLVVEIKNDLEELKQSL